MIGGLFLNILTPDKALSFSERRPLSNLPPLTLHGVFTGDYSEAFEKYALDQMVLREDLRSLKAFMQYRIFGKLDNNGIYLGDSSVYKLETYTDHKQIQYFTDKLNAVYSKYLERLNVHYAIIPDKNFYMDSEGVPKLDYDFIVNHLYQSLSNMDEIDLFNVLKSDDYYATDLHWKQENLQSVVDHLMMAMGNETKIDFSTYDIHEFHPFYGAYYGQSALSLSPDKLIYLKKPWMEGITVTHLDQMIVSNVLYDVEKLESIDAYDVFLSGPSAIVEMTNPQATTEKELILFRDSFGSSIAPMLLEAYQKITLVDLRYIPSDQLGEYIAFENQDVLFLFSTTVINKGFIIK